MSVLNTKCDDLLEWIVVLLLLDGCVHVGDPRWRAIDATLRSQQTLSGRPITAIATMFEIKRRLAGRLFELGRRRRISESNRSFLSEARFDELVAHDRAAQNPKIRLKYIGMRGVAHMLLARGDANPMGRYERARRDLEEFRTLGDLSAQHDQYLIEAYLKLLDVTVDPSHLDRA
jgi:hypothetical protein